MFPYVHVAVARPLAGELTYASPPLLGSLAIGHVVLVPLGAQGETGYVVGTTETPDCDPARVRPVSRVLDRVPAFDGEQLAFFRWVADYYMAPLGMVIHTALPSGIRARVVHVLTPTDDGIAALTRREVDGHAGVVLREAIARPGLTRRGLERRLADEIGPNGVKAGLDLLARRGWAAWGERAVDEVKGRVKTVAPGRPLDPDVRLGKRMAVILDEVSRAPGPIDLAELLLRNGSAARASLDRLLALGAVVLGDRENRDPLDEPVLLGSADPPELHDDQRAVVNTLDGASGTHLLFGVTGSGKTEVFLRAARTVVDRGGQVLVLVPEIGLTPQLVGRFRARFGERVAVLHSALTGAERLAQWRRIRAGDVDVAVGARSALFAPFPKLGLVVVDEEHDDSYKQDDGVPYNARDLAVVLGQRRGCPVVLASATPSLESWHNALSGRYRLLRLPRRATPRPVPAIEIVDLSAVPVAEGTPRPLLAPLVEDALRDTFTRGGQAIVLYNRRGYATLVECSACGATYECPNCAIAMTLHRTTSRVCCHYCGLKLPYDRICPVCHAPGMDEEGKGTERVEETLAALFPAVPLARMDADTTSERGAHHRILAAFREGRTQLLVGTQIVAKGHDFPGVHTAVVVSADRSLRLPDFRSAERTMALVVQLAGRAGRGEVPGRVFVQTWNPAHYVLRHLHDLEAFYRAELKLRSTLRYPPHSRLCVVRLEGVERRAVAAAASDLGRELRARSGAGVSVLGPAPAALPRLVGRWRFQIIVRGENAGALRRCLAASRRVLEAASRKGVRVGWDVDPRNLM